MHAHGTRSFLMMSFATYLQHAQTLWMTTAQIVSAVKLSKFPSIVFENCPTILKVRLHVLSYAGSLECAKGS